MSETTPRGSTQTRSSPSPMSKPAGWWGMALLVSTEAALFGSLIASYFYLRLDATSWPPAGTPEPTVALPTALTAALLASAIPVLLAARAADVGRVGRAWVLLALAALVQGAYLGLQIQLFARDLNDFSPAASAYGSIYFTLLAVHHAHVMVGIALDAWLLGKLAGGLTKYRMTALRALTVYWMFVAVVGVLVTFTILLPAL